MTLCQTCFDEPAERGSRQCVNCSTGRPADASTSVAAVATPLSDVPARIETAKLAILDALDGGGPMTGTELSFTLSRELRENFAPAAAELVDAGVIVSTTNRHSCTYRLASLSETVNQ